MLIKSFKTVIGLLSPGNKTINFTLTQDSTTYSLDFGELNYRLRVVYNNSNLVPKSVLVVTPTPRTYRRIKHIFADEPRSI